MGRSQTRHDLGPQGQEPGAPRQRETEPKTFTFVTCPRFGPLRKALGKTWQNKLACE